jgi:phosphoenolpyruvate synthase/pyruvate phosphate dikinase
MITNAAEFKDIAEFIATVATQMGVKRDQYDLACMLEIPAACKDFTIQEIIESQAPYPVHFSFGTNDLTAGESSLGRTSAKYITTQVARGVFSDDYAQKLTPAVEHDIAVVSGVVKSANTDRPEEEQIHLGICGSHGSYHPNLPFLQKNLDYIAVTPPELTAASVAAAQNQILLNQARDRAIWAVNVGSYTQ